MQTCHRLTVFAIAVVALLTSACQAADPALAGAPRYLFLDPALLESTDGAELAVNPAQQREIVIRADRPWEQLMISLFLTVRDEGDRLRMWYICRDRENRPNVAYAESTDGLHWEKPNLGIVEYAGSTDNNLVGLSSLEGAVYRDPHAASPEEAYLYLAHVSGKGLVRHTSPDGLHWKADKQALLPFSFDTQNVAFWDDQIGCYVLYLRGWTSGSRWQDRLRNVKRLTAERLAEPLGITPSGNEISRHRSGVRSHMTDEVPTNFAADEHDAPNTDVYNTSAQPYPLDPRWYVGFPSFLHREKNVSDGRLEVQFIGSRDGIAWHRYDRRPYAVPGPQGTENANMVFLGTGLVVRNNEIWQYGVGLHTRHGDMQARYEKTDGTIYRYTQRIDGFVSLDFGNDEGFARTIPVQVTGGKLLLNVDTGALGSLQVGLLDENGQPVPGFGLEDCVPLKTNALAVPVKWQGEPDWSAVEGRELQLTFRGRRAKLFSFRFDSE